MFRTTPTTKRRLLDERKADFSDVDRHQEYPMRLNMYKLPPLQEITDEEFETWALDRLRLLSEIDMLQARGRSFNEIREAIIPVMDKTVPLSMSSKKAQEERKKDHYSHFILRLAFCQTPDLQEKFVRLEATLFHIRFEMEDVAQRRKLISSLDDGAWVACSAEEVQELSDKLQTVNPGQTSFFKIDFLQVPELVERRRAFIKNGRAYVAESEQQVVIVEEFRKYLMYALNETAKKLPKLDEKERIEAITKNLALGFTAQLEYNSSGSQGAVGDGGDVKASDVELLKRHFPPCMWFMHDNLVRTGHAKYDTREQYGLFLKAIGLNVDESLKFWRHQFRGMTEDKFNKDYRYNIRYNYGMEGRRISRAPLQCSRIIASQPSGAEQTQGCPFKHLGQDALGNLLGKMGLKDADEKQNIMEHVKKTEYQVACTRMYECTHPGDDQLSEPIVHPNGYYLRSLNFEKSQAAQKA